MIGGKRGVVCRWGGSVVGRLGRRVVGSHLLVVGGALVGHLSHVTIDMVSGIMDVLGSTVRQGDRVGSCY